MISISTAAEFSRWLFPSNLQQNKNSNFILSKLLTGEDENYSKNVATQKIFFFIRFLGDIISKFS